jgi:hypothetical protein
VQLPGMSYDPVRLSLDVTWWPDEASFGVSRRLWTRPYRGSSWVLEDMATSASPITVGALRDRWGEASQISLDYFIALTQTQGDPF